MPKKKKKKKQETTTTSRKTITITKTEWEKWQPIKGSRSWTFLLRDARIALETVESLRDINRKLNETLQQVAVENAKLLGGGVRVMTQNVHPDAMLNWKSKTEHTIPSKSTLSSGRNAELLKEIRELEDQEGGIRSILKPISPEELQTLQLSEEELNKAMEVQLKRVQMRHLKPPSPPSTK